MYVRLTPASSSNSIALRLAHLPIK